MGDYEDMMKWFEKWMKWLFPMLFILLLSLSMTMNVAMAEDTPHLNDIKYALNVVASASNNVYNNSTINFNPETLEQVDSATVDLYGDFNSGNTITLMVNNTSCNPPSFTFSGGTRQERMYFDCTNAIHGRGNYTVSWKWSSGGGSAYFQNAFGNMEILYHNNPISISSGGTEYSPNANGTVYVRLIDANDNPINIGSCNTTIFYPNKTTFINNQVMTFLKSGYYYKDLTVPSIEGVYITSFDCIMPASQFNQNESIEVTLASGNSYTNVFDFDDSNNVTINSAFIDLFNARSSTYTLTLNGNLLLTGGSGLSNVTVNPNKFSLSESQSYTIMSVAGTTEIDWIRMYINYTAPQPQQIIRGQTEIHVSTQNVNNTDVINGQNNILNAIASVNNTVNNSFIGTNALINAINASITANQQQILQNIATINNTLVAIGLNVTDIDNDVHQINNTANQINNTANQINNTASQINATATQINTTTNQNQALLNAISGKIDTLNATANQILALANNLTINEATDRQLLQQINMTAMQVNTTANSILAVANKINSTTSQINGTVTQINATANQILLATSPLEAKLDYINMTANNIYSTVQTINGKIDNIQANTTQIIGILNSMNLTEQQILSITSQINGTVNSIQGTVNNIQFTVNQINDTITEIKIGNITVTVNSTQFQQEISTGVLNTLLANRDVIGSYYSTDTNVFSGITGLASASGSFVNSEDMCLDNTTLQHNITFTYCQNNACTNNSYIRPQTCPYGCSSNACNPSPFAHAFIFILVVIILPIVVLWFIFRLSR